MKNCKIIILISLLFLITYTLKAQSDSLNVKNLTRTEVLKLDYNQLLALPFEDLLYLANKLGVSIDELLNMTVSSKTS